VKPEPPLIGLRTLIQELWGPEGGGRQRLPPDEMSFDKWAYARRLGFGEDSCAHHNSYIYGDVKVGAHSWVGPFTLLDGSGGLEIGDFCMVCAGVQIYTHDSVKWALSAGRVSFEKASVEIGDCCYLGAGSIITRGVTIGDHTIVGAGSLVNRDLPPYAVAVGSPCRIIGRVTVAEDGTVEIVPNQAATERKSPPASS
jgi:acetyltransferase-like isoleucine patch superfamily enzyme